ncbi:hypothetical protein OC842_001809 [Tilletia horrida]|uniref:Phosducin thioredoxin-like domain-containing protein n=1 Tax=Tilletia horrida TaxID=155126 RepID=A0AAN6GJ91_9BASI|nr:hypothetical protein OC842_001809 [Tilletia horrida]
MSDPLEDLVLNGGADARRTAAELPGIEHSRRGPDDDKRSDDADGTSEGDAADELDDDFDGDNDAGPMRSGGSSHGARDVMPRSRAESYNTGPKGVMQDQKDRAAANARSDAERIRATNAAMQRMALTANTVDEEEAHRKKELRAAGRTGDGDAKGRNSCSDDDEPRGEKTSSEDDRVDPAAAAEFAARERRRAQRIEELQREAERRRAAVLGAHIVGRADTPPQRADVWFGHLREVDAIGYVRATEEERDDVPVVFVQVRALSVGFGLSDDDVDATVEDEDEDHADFLARQDALLAQVEPILPTLHIYRGGELLVNLVRIDMEDDWQSGKETAIRDILLHHRAISEVRTQGRSSHARDSSVPTDADFDLDD